MAKYTAPQETKTHTLLKLPDDALTVILSQLSYQERCRTSSVCKKFLATATDLTLSEIYEYKTIAENNRLSLLKRLPAGVQRELAATPSGHYPRPPARELITAGYVPLELSLDPHIPAKNLIDGLFPNKKFTAMMLVLALLFLLCRNEHDMATPFILMALPSIILLLQNIYCSTQKIMERQKLNKLMTPYYQNLSAIDHLSQYAAKTEANKAKTERKAGTTQQLATSGKHSP